MQPPTINFSSIEQPQMHLQLQLQMQEKEPEPEPAEFLTLGEYAERAYLDYALSVVKGRALPAIGDGQKPVQRRILYAMHEMGLSADAKPVKSARVVGDVLGKYHPHGDQSAYDALVRLAQDFSLRYPLINGQGNFGSRDGDSAAAMRYTEARLTPIARLLLDEIHQGTVDFIPNYDGSIKEPKQLPARLPFILLNGASGIAVGLATEIPPHNLREVAAAVVALIRNPNLSHTELLQTLPGPDFPGGAQLISSAADISAVYQAGRGSLKMRARWKIETLARGQWQLVVTELPPNTSSQKILEEIEELANPKVKPGKKALTAEQLQTKQTLLVWLDAVRDEAGKAAAVRLVFEPKSNRIDPNEFIQVLLAHTSLESNVGINLVMIGADNRPRQKPLLEILQEWIACRFAVLTRGSRFQLAKVQERIHILEGRMIVFLNLDQVIRIIRESDVPNPKSALINTFGLSPTQADDILDLRLRQLARLENITLEKELAQLRNSRRKLEALLNSDMLKQRQLIREIEADATQYGDLRRTLIQPEQRAVFEARAVDEPVTVIVSQQGWVRTQKGHLESSLFSFKTGDALYNAFQCRTPDSLIAFGDRGRVYSVPVATLPGARGNGAPITSMIELEPGTRLAHYFAAPTEQSLLLATNIGVGFIAKTADMTSRLKAGKAFITVDPKATLLTPVPVPVPVPMGREIDAITPAISYIACLSSTDRLLVFDINEVKTLPNGGRGVKLITLKAGETLAQVTAFGNTGLVIAGVGRGGKSVETTLVGASLKPYIAQRAQRGRRLAVKFKEIVLRAG